jgi:hypothetical protein
MTENTDKTHSETSNLAPVFSGLALVGVTGKAMAAALRLSTASISKWRNGHSTMPDEVRIFLTLMLGDHIERAGEYAGQTETDESLDEARRFLHQQERHNSGIPAMAIREGALRYRLWWNASRNAACLQPEHMMRDIGSQVAAGIR